MCSRGLRTCKFHISVLELASYNNLSKRTFSLFQHPGYVSVVQLAIDHDDDVGITFDKYGPDRLDNSFPSGGFLSSGAFFLWVIGRK